MNPLSFQQKLKSPVIFSFGQDNNSGAIYIQDNYIVGAKSHNKYQFIQSLIDKYEQKPLKLKEIVNRSSEDTIALSSDIKDKFEKKASLLLKQNRTECQEKEKPPKSQFESTSPSKSEIKAELEQSHKEIVGKYQSAVRDDSKNNNEPTETQPKPQTEKLIKLIVVQSDEKSQSPVSRLQSNTSGSIPMVQSILIPNKIKGNSFDKKEEAFHYAIKPPSEFEIEEEESVEIKKNFAPEVKSAVQNEKQEEESDQKIIAFYLLILLVLLYCCFFSKTKIDEF